MCAVEEWKKDVEWISSGSEASEEVAKVECSVGFVGAEGVDAVAVAYHKAC